MGKYLAYSFLYDNAADLRCDFELLSDEISSMIGLLRSLLDDTDKAAAPALADDLSRINELMYHINPSLRTKIMVTEAELEWLHGATEHLQTAVREGLPSSGNVTFLLPQGCTPAAYCHLIRCKCKMLVRLLSRHRQQGNEVDELVFDFTNLYSGYFYSLALWFNHIHGVPEQAFVSRVY